MSINSFRAPIAISAASVAAAVRFAQYARISMPVVLLAAMASLTSAAASPGVACAAPDDGWDKRSYQTCQQYNFADFTAGTTNSAQYRERVQYCCYRAGGMWNDMAGAPGNAEGGDCVDPPPFAVPRPTFNEDLLAPRPPREPRPDMPTPP
jgi:hypothetical protein